MCIAAAIVGAGVVGAAGSAIAGSEAAGATKDAANQASADQRTALQQQSVLSQPYRDLATGTPGSPGQPGTTGAITQLQSLLGLNGQDPTAALRSTPGYQFAQQQGLDATKNAAASAGMLNSGNTLQALDRFSTGLADQTYQQAVGNAENVVGIGQAAAAGQAANIGNAAGNLSNIAIGQGNNLANIDVNTIAGISRAAGGAANNYVTQNTLANLNNPGFTSQDLSTLSSGAGSSPTLNFGDGYTYNNPPMGGF